MNAALMLLFFDGFSASTGGLEPEPREAPFVVVDPTPFVAIGGVASVTVHPSTSVTD